MNQKFKLFDFEVSSDFGAFSPNIRGSGETATLTTEQIKAHTHIVDTAHKLREAAREVGLDDIERALGDVVSYSSNNSADSH